MIIADTHWPTHEFKRKWTWADRNETGSLPLETKENGFCTSFGCPRASWNFLHTTILGVKEVPLLLACFHHLCGPTAIFRKLQSHFGVVEISPIGPHAARDQSEGAVSY